MKVALALTVAFSLAGCGEPGERPIFVCQTRDVVSGTCTQGKYVCREPLELVGLPDLTPRCVLQKSPQ